MKKRLMRMGLLALLMVMAYNAWSENCEPNYTCPYFSMNGALVEGNSTSTHFNTKMTIGQPFIQVSTNYSTHSSAPGFWSFYMKEPRPPIVRASDGDFQDMVLIEWTIEDDRTGPPVTGDEVQLLRNGYPYATLPVSQTAYQDLSVFPGEYYSYGVISSNEMGDSHMEGNLGFLNPNGIITGHIETPSGNPVQDTKVMLTPNLGRSAYFAPDEESYIYFMDPETSLNRLFTGFLENYTIETWFRSTHTDHVQTIIAAVDSSTIDHYVKLEILEGGYLHWEHNPTAGNTGSEITTLISYSGFDDWGNGHWHHVACVFDSLEMTMYVDGFIVGTAIANDYIEDDVEVMIGKSAPLDNSNYFYGRLDDLRIWNSSREWEDIRKYQDITLSGDEEGLSAYWKFDEVEGDIIFDLTSNDNDGKICHIERSANLAPVYVGALTDSVGNYVIRGIYYGGGTTFTVTPSKETNIGRAIELDGVSQYISFEGVRVDMTLEYTQEGWFKTPEAREQVIFAVTDPASDESRIIIKMDGLGNIQATHLTTELTNSSNMADNLWHHYALSYDQEILKLYIDGELVDESIELNVIPNLSELVIGRAAPEIDDMYFLGKLDEMRLWNVYRNFDQITGTMNQPLDGDEFGLANYWKMNEGSDILITDATGNIATGTLENGLTWTEDIPLLEMFDHYYEPESRQASLNNSNTAVDMVNFTDISMIPISGYIRYESTACFQEGVQIIVNGESLIPPIFTDADGKWIIELEPGSTGDIIAPVYEEHEFLPPFIELPLISSPRTGLYFSDQELREVSGIVAGGSCEYPITPEQGQIEVTVRAVNGCIEKKVVPHAITGQYKIEDLPPFIYQIWIDHPDPEIDAFFDADTLSLEEENRVFDFIYYSPPQITINNIPPAGEITLPDDSVISDAGLMTMNEFYEINIEVNEAYSTWQDGETVINYCPVDSGSVQVIDHIARDIDTTYVFTSGSVDYQLKANMPNILAGGEHPYQKQITVIATDNFERQASATEWVIVTGNRPRTTNFTTTTPDIPLMILRDPPGDWSKSTFSSTEEHSMSVGFSSIHNSSSSDFVEVHLGVDLSTSTGLFVSVDTEFNSTYDINQTTTMGAQNTSTTEQTWTFSTTESISTSDDDTFIGENGDIYMGGAMNLLYGVTDILTLEDGVLDLYEDLIIAPNGFATNYLYSESHIVNTLIPSLYDIGDEESAQRWQSFVDRNHQLKESATLVTNRSFDAGAEYEYSETSETTQTTSYEFEMFVCDEVAIAVGMDLNGVGVLGGFNVSTQLTLGSSRTSEVTHSNTVGYTLSDDDIGDYFSLDVKWDDVYGTPVFDLISGASSNPWEHGTLKIDNPTLEITPAAQVNIPAEEAANFTMLLGNISELEADREYWFRILNESNPDGAQISVNGIYLEDHLSYLVPYGEQLEVQLSIERGPEEYVYEELQFMLVPPGQYELWENGGALELTAFADVSVEFQQPASDVHIAVPDDNWLVNSSHGSDTLWVTMDGYNRLAENLVSIDLQYRQDISTRENLVCKADASPSFGKASQKLTVLSENSVENKETASDERVGEWFTAYSVLKENVAEDYILMPWNITPNLVVDGEYQLRAVTISTGDSGNGYSNIVTGIIDRAGPQVFGNPDPVDGILGADDEIAIHFNENINGELINPGNQDIALWNTTTGQQVDFNYTYGFNTITIEPAVNNEWIENQTLRADINALQDMYGNSIAEPVSWEFFVNRNPVSWVGESISEIVYSDETVEETRILRNSGGSNRSFEIIGGRDNGWPSGNPLPIPEWLDISPSSGTITPGGDLVISINLTEDTPAGIYSTIIYANTVMGDEPIQVDIRVLDYPPDWEVQHAQYQYSMNMTAELFIDNDLSEDLYDIVSVFVGNEIRGVGEIRYLPEITHQYQTFITIYSNVLDGEQLSFKVWDSSESIVLANILESYDFVANSVLGTPAAPVSITASNEVLQNVELISGWNWLSFNLECADMGLNSILGSAEFSSSDLIKNQSFFAQYVEDYGWVGSLAEIDNKSMYLMKVTEEDTLEISGYPVNVETETILVNPGWNWISFLPQYSMELNYALSSLDRLTSGDIIKNQTSFAQYLEGYGWFGNMQFMQPNTGYLLRLTYSGELIYPFELISSSIPEEAFEVSASSLAGLRTELINRPALDIKYNSYQYSMNIISTVEHESMPSVAVMDQIVVYCDGICVGAGSPVFISQTEEWLFFITAYSNELEGNELEFCWYSSNADEVLPVQEGLVFNADHVEGSIMQPYQMITEFCTATEDDVVQVLETGLNSLYPNPFNPDLHISYSIKEELPVELAIYNVKGQKVKTLVDGFHDKGVYDIIWLGDNDQQTSAASGIYFLIFKAGQYRTKQKVILMK